MLIYCAIRCGKMLNSHPAPQLAECFGVLIVGGERQDWHPVVREERQDWHPVVRGEHGIGIRSYGMMSQSSGHSGWFLLGGVALAAALSCASDLTLAAEPAKAGESHVYTSRIGPLLRQHCLDCHGAKKQEAELDFRKFPDEKSLLADRKTWESVLDMVESDAMPPADRPRLAADDRRVLVRYLERVLFNLDCEKSETVDPGRVTIRRLNRVEYNNTVRDLLGVEFRPADDFPSDDVGHGFDNIGDVLSVSPLLVEKYLAAAERIATAALASADTPQPGKTRPERARLQVEGSARAFPVRYPRHYVARRRRRAFEAPRNGEYFVRVRAAGQQAGDELPRLELRVDDKVVKTFEVSAQSDRPTDHETRSDARRGAHRLAAHFINDFYDPEAKRPQNRDRNLLVGAFELEGPLDVRSPSDPRPRLDAGRATRRPVGARGGPTDARAARASRFQRARAKGRSTPTPNSRNAWSIAARATRRGWRSPSRLSSSRRISCFASNGTRPRKIRADRHAVSDFELASRLSYFLWSSMPDEELLALAEEGRICATRTCSSNRRGACCGSDARRRSPRTSPPSGSTSAASTNRRPTRGSSPRSTRVTRRTCSARPSWSSTPSCGRTAACSNSSTPISRSSTSGWRSTTGCAA